MKSCTHHRLDLLNALQPLAVPVVRKVSRGMEYC